MGYTNDVSPIENEKRYFNRLTSVQKSRRDSKAENLPQIFLIDGDYS